MFPSVTDPLKSRVTMSESVSRPSFIKKKMSCRLDVPIKHSISIFEQSLEQTIIVLYKGEDVTPQELRSKKFVSSKSHDLVESRKDKLLSRKSTRVTRFSTGFRTGQTIYVKKKISQASLTNLIADKNLANFTDTEEYDDLEGEVPSAMCMPYEFPATKFPETMKIILQETDSITLFELQSKTVTKGTPEAEYVDKQNEIYEYLTVGKGKNRKKITTEAQTVEQILKTRHTIVQRGERKNNYAFASVWDMFDSYKEVKEEDEHLLGSSDELQALRKLYDIDESHEDSDTIETEEGVKIKVTLNKQNLLDAACIMERVLANNNLKVKQENYKGLLRFEADQLLCESFNYVLKSLWTFKYDRIKNRPVMVIGINPMNTDIISVGYGKYKYTDVTSGMVCIWNIKNPTQPERLYEFESPVTTATFSENNPNLLAIGLYNGEVCILDITSYEKKTVTKSSRKTSLSYLPIWQLKWRIDKEMENDVEQVISINIGGRIEIYTQSRTKDFICVTILKILHIDDKDKTMKDIELCSRPDDIPLFKTTNNHIHCWHPTLDDVYFIGTSGGCIYKCSTNYFDTYIESFVAHRGPVNGMEFSKFCSNIFVTCGADWTVKIWKENIHTPLVVLMTNMNPVMCVKFSPTHSTVITAISGSQIYLWNIKHKTDSASLVHDLAPKFGTLTSIDFSQNGKNVIVSDVNGKVHMRFLLGLFPPEGNQSKILENALQSCLIIQPDLVKLITKKEKLQSIM